MKTSTTVLAVALCALLAVAKAAEDTPKAEPTYDSYGKKSYDEYHYEAPPASDYPKHSTKVFSLYGGDLISPCNSATTTCGNTIGFSRVMFADSGKTQPVGTLYQTGIVAKGALSLADTRLIYWQSFRFTGANGFGEGTIQTQGDDTGVDDPTFTNRAITGGTGVFTGASGYVSRGGNPATVNPGPYTFYLSNWKGSGYGY